MRSKLLMKLMLNMTIVLLCAGLCEQRPSRSPSVESPTINSNIFQLFFHAHKLKHRPMQTDPRHHLLLLILLAHDIELNPGPRTYCVYNVTDTKVILSRRRNIDQLDRLQKQKLFEELTQIDSTEFIGDDYCPACWNKVQDDQDAISCDKCSHWIHLKCSDMSQNMYNRNINSTFPWICNLCRDEEFLPDECCYIPMTGSQFQDNGPESLNQLTSAKGPLILHFNYRSVKNKIDEVRIYTGKSQTRCSMPHRDLARLLMPPWLFKVSRL